MTAVLIAILIAAAIAAAAGFCLLARRGRSLAAVQAEVLRLQAELRNSAVVMAAKEESLKRRLEDKDASCERILRAKDEANARIIAEKDATISKFLKEKEASFAAAVETLREKFSNIALEFMKTNAEDLAKANSASMNALLAPLRDQVRTLQDLADKAQRETSAFGTSMAKDVADMGSIAKSLQNVATALTSNTRFQGRKGEEVLAEKLRQAGLEENVNFFLQRGTDSDRPDAQVRDTENRWLVIDSKVSLVAYMEYMDAKDEATKAEKLRLHVANVRQKIDQLAMKKYPQVFAAEYGDRDYLPITAMFVPYEAPLLEALKAEPSLWQYAAENNVVLVTPLTLLAYLRLVYLAWQHAKEARNQQEIVNTARELLVRTNAFLKTFEEVGAAIDSLAGAYGRAKGILVDAPHAQTIGNSARKLIDLHVRLENKKGRKVEMAECLSQGEP